MTNYIADYYGKIESGEIVTSRRVKAVYKGILDDIAAGKYVYDEKRGSRPIDFIERFCRHSKGEWAGKVVKLELFQKAYIAALFGVIDPATNLRRFRESLFLVARKNGKTTMMSGIAAYMMLADGEKGSDCYSTATKKDQAKLLFDETLNMVKQSALLSKYIKKRKSDMYCEKTMSRFAALGKNSNSLDGLNAQLVIADELHGVRDRNLYEVMKQSQSARRQPLFIMITTAGTVRECIYDDMYDYASKVLDGSVKDEKFLPVLYELDDRAEWTDPTKWIKANPALGSIKKLDDLQGKVDRAKNSPADLAGVLTKDFNIREKTSQAWLTYSAINNTEIFDLERFKESYCIGGADLSITTDLTAATILLMDANEKRYVKQMYWLPADHYADRLKEKIPYDKWKEQGYLRLCSGNCINYRDVTAWFKEIYETYSITPLWIYYDSYSARYWVDEMETYGFKMVRCIQGARTLSGPMYKLGADLDAKLINYGNNPILKWCLTNTGIQTDRNGNIVPIKSQLPKMRIDGAASLLDAYVGLCDHYDEYLSMIK